ncbi:MAG: ABC transporter substrate-binding protein [Spirochaetales bacterium]|nr:ABC transporter substrate-binding protein [Spirochaetales bacterium]
MKIPCRIGFPLILLVLNLFPLSPGEIVLASSNIQQERKEELRYLCRVFELYHPGVTIKLLDYSDETPEELFDEKGHSKADVLIADSPILQQLARSEKLDRQAAETVINDLGTDLFYRGSLEALYCPATTSYCAIPYTAWLQLIWYRQDLLKKAGLNTPQTADELISTARDIEEQNLSPYGIIVGNQQDRYLLQCYYHLGNLAYSGKSSSREGLYQEQILEFYRTLSQLSPNGEMTWRARDYYFQNQVPFLVYSTHLMDDIAIEEIAADSLTGNNFPELPGQGSGRKISENTRFISTLYKGEEPISFGSVTGWGIFKDSEEKETVQELIHFFFRHDTYISYMHMSPGGMLPVRKDLTDDNNFYRDPQGVFLKFGKETIMNLCQSIEYLHVLPNEENFSSARLYKELWKEN